MASVMFEVEDVACVVESVDGTVVLDAGTLEPFVTEVFEPVDVEDVLGAVPSPGFFVEGLRSSV
jgi:hypothetical protein